MAEANDTAGIIHQNLEDSGCDKQTIQICMALVERGNMKGLLPFLAKQKTTLLNNVHVVQKKIDCLDYLIYKIQKEIY